MIASARFLAPQKKESQTVKKFLVTLKHATESNVNLLIPRTEPEVARISRRVRPLGYTVVLSEVAVQQEVA